jgi:hypothetical protein
VVAITDGGAKSKAHGISLFIVEEGMPGYVIFTKILPGSYQFYLEKVVIFCLIYFSFFIVKEGMPG